MNISQTSLPFGVKVRDLAEHFDERGSLFELFRKEWDTGCDPMQWVVSQSHAGVLRGVHVHGRHTDYLIVLSGRMVLGLHDIRLDSGTRGQSWLVELTSETRQAVTIPPGVCHGFYFPVPSIYINGVSSYWDKRDELGCRFDAPEMAFDWPEGNPILSARDTDGGRYEDMCTAYAVWRAEVLRGEA